MKSNSVPVVTSLDDSKTTSPRHQQKGGKLTSAELDLSESKALKAAFQNNRGQNSSSNLQEYPHRARGSSGGGGGGRFKKSDSSRSKLQKIGEEGEEDNYTLAIYFLESSKSSVELSQAF